MYLIVDYSITRFYNRMMITITINGVDYKISIEKTSLLIQWLQDNGATKVLENTNPHTNGRTLINE
jgi:aerobic-type carbon monoxide dehydrogenase small subunit (CoxS/CutS family)